MQITGLCTDKKGCQKEWPAQLDRIPDNGLLKSLFKLYDWVFYEYQLKVKQCYMVNRDKMNNFHLLIKTDLKLFHTIDDDKVPM